MSPQGIERLDRPPQEREFQGKLMPGDIYLSDAMATSAAAVDHHMGALEGEELFKDLKVTLGIAMGTSIVSDPRQEKRLNICLQVGKPIFKRTNELNLQRAGYTVAAGLSCIAITRVLLVYLINKPLLACWYIAG